MNIKEYEDRLISTAQEAVKIRSYSDEEGELALFLKRTMEKLGYDEVRFSRKCCRKNRKRR